MNGRMHGMDQTHGKLSLLQSTSLLSVCEEEVCLVLYLYKSAFVKYVAASSRESPNSKHFVTFFENGEVRCTYKTLCSQRVL